ncbi:hypothetical protein PsYK624_149730 [Phanerochaete sordida]|uniref:Uncharacterized protein n=1 Tax=Phanerochaete sordida TaxID=48140 RepID=A0A9P3GPJ8_9APHY|nr:hypothetical protein PsYK624_149730 [Phanerochaete sordida]
MFGHARGSATVGTEKAREHKVSEITAPTKACCRQASSELSLVRPLPTSPQLPLSSSSCRASLDVISEVEALTRFSGLMEFVKSSVVHPFGRQANARVGIRLPSPSMDTSSYTFVKNVAGHRYDSSA